MKKMTLAAMIAASTITLSNTTWAQTPGDQQEGSVAYELAQLSSSISALPASITSGIGGGLQGLEQYIGNLYLKGQKWIKHRDHRPIPDIQNIVATNTTKTPLKVTKTVVVTEKTGNYLIGYKDTTTEKKETTEENLSPTEAAARKAEIETSNNLHNTLKQFFYSMYQKDKTLSGNITTAQGQPFSDYLSNNSLTALTVGTQGNTDDTLYVADEASKSNSDYQNPNMQPWLKKPDMLSNTALNFANLFTPAGYSPYERTSALTFVKYAAQSTQNFTADLNFDQLFGNPGALYKLKLNPVYQQFVFSLRSLLAIRSISINALDQLIAERTKMKNLGPAAGLSANEEASPLEVEKYQASRRIEDPTWYQHMQHQSPAVVQRDILIVLAEIEKQNYQAHLDRERILAAITAMSLQSNSAAANNLMLEGNSKLKSAISDALGKGTPVSTKTNTTTQVPTATAGETNTTSETTIPTNKTNKTNNKK